MSKSCKTKDHGGGHKGSGKDHGGGHQGGGNDRPDNVCKTDSQPNPTPKPDPKPCPPADDNDCRPIGGSDHHGAVISADVDADISANVLQCDSLAELGCGHRRPCGPRSRPRQLARVAFTMIERPQVAAWGRFSSFKQALRQSINQRIQKRSRTVVSVRSLPAMAALFF